MQRMQRRELFREFLNDVYPLSSRHVLDDKFIRVPEVRDSAWLRDRRSHRSADSTPVVQSICPSDRHTNERTDACAERNPDELADFSAHHRLL